MRALARRALLTLVAMSAAASASTLAYDAASFYDGSTTGFVDVPASALPSGLSIKYRVDRRADASSGEQGSVTFVVRNANGAVWTGLGFNSNPGMFGGDFVVFEPGATRATFRDMHNHKKPYEAPVDDDVFNLTPLRAYKSSSSVEFEFSRPLVACRVPELDESTVSRRRLLAAVNNAPRPVNASSYMSASQDVSINAKQGLYLLYAWGSGATFSQHAQNARGAHFIHIVDEPEVNVIDINSYVDVRPRVATEMGTTSTFYACTKHDLGTTARYVTGWEVINANPANLHHAQLYACTDGTNAQNDVLGSGSGAKKDYGYSVNGGSFTGDPSASASDVSSCSSMNEKCAEVVASWAIGGGRVVFPNGTSRVFGGSGSNAIRYVLLERHFNNNVATVAALRDSSGFRLFTTTAAPTNGEVGIFLAGIPASNLLTIGANGMYSHVAKCPGACTTRLFGTQEMRMFAYFPHQHTTGRASFVRHVRNGVELPPLTSTPFYDFDFQVFNWMNNFTRIVKPGDDLVVECVYDTRGRTNPTTMGEATTDEMCFMYFLYYPKMDLFSCFDLQAVQYTSCARPGGLSRIGVDVSTVLANAININVEYENSAIATCATSSPPSSPLSSSPLPPPPLPSPPPSSGQRAAFGSMTLPFIFAVLCNFIVRF